MRITWNPPKVPPITATYTWAAEYSAAVHEGAQRDDGTVLPARPWTKAAIEETDLEAALAENFRKKLDVVEAFEDTAYYLGGRFETMIRDERWEWDRITYRRNGTIAGYIRDITDTEKLVNSQSEPQFS